MTALGPFRSRLAGQLSGGMKQKLGLACTLVRSPELLLLDEPTVGVDPISRRELWEIVRRLVAEQGLTVVLSTAYLDEAERCSRIILLHQGKMLSQSSPQQVAALAAGHSFVATPPAQQSARALQARLLAQPDMVDAVPDGGRVRFVRAAVADPAVNEHALRGLSVVAVPPRFEDGFMMLLSSTVERERLPLISVAHPVAGHAGDAVVQVQGLLKKFGAFTAVDHISFEVRRGEIFGLLGPNGAGKTTTFRMLCGLLLPTAGQLRVAGADVRSASAAARAPARVCGPEVRALRSPRACWKISTSSPVPTACAAQRKRARIAWATQQFELGEHLRTPSAQLPGGYKQRLAMAAALLHEPEILFLDEPTSGADPLARRAFWRRITALADQGVTIIVTTHFMQEAEYCDHVAIMDSGQVLSQGSPAEVRQRARTKARPEPSMEDAFIAVVEQARAAQAAA